MLFFTRFRERKSSSKKPGFFVFCTLKIEWQIYPLLVRGNVGRRTISLKHIETLFSTFTFIKGIQDNSVLNIIFLIRRKDNEKEFVR